MSRNSGGKRPLVAEKRTRPAARKPKATKPKAAQRSTAPKTGKKTVARKPVKRTARPKTPRKQSGGGTGGGLLSLPKRMFSWIIGVLWAISWRFGLVLGVFLAGAIGLIYSQLPPASEMVDGRARGSVTLMDNTGEVFAWRGDQFGGVITAETVSPHLKNAIVATEDRRFYRHLGVSPRGVLSAVRINLSEGRSALQGHGGSTITQQTAKLLCIGKPYDPAVWKDEAAYEADCRRGSIGRKIHEAVYALAMEARYTKDEILTIYMNRAYLGAGARGFQAASQRYFGKSAAEVSPAEAAMLAGLLVAPTRYAPTSNLELSRNRANLIIGLMEDQEYLSTAEAADARANPAALSSAAEARAGGYFADWIMESTPSFLSSETTEDVLIRTTFDARLQTAAESALKDIFENKVRPGSKAQAAIVVMDADGAVRAMVGGRKTNVSGAFNRATHALRQPGSSFKPFIYATALELGYSYRDQVEDAPLTINVPGSGPWSPKNYTREYMGMVTLTEALKDSLNIPAVKVQEFVGRQNVIKVATDFGIGTDLVDSPALALGASETTLLEMTAAYAGILNGGSSVTPYGMTELRLMDDSEALMGQDGGIGERVISQNAARQLVYMMNQVIEDGSGKRARLEGRPAAGKTGTTQAARDAWFVGFTGDYVAGVWMGYDDNTPLTGVTGGGLPAEIWHETMIRVHEGLPVTPLPMITPDTSPAPDRVAGGTQTTQPRTPANVAEKVLNDVLGLFKRN